MTHRSGSLLVLLALAACDSSSSSATLPAGDGGTFEGGGDDGQNPPSPVDVCPTPTGAPTTHDARIEADETWGAGIHEVTFDILIHKNATLTIEPCAIVRVAANHDLVVGTVNVGDGGKLVAKGTADMPIVIEAKDATPWADLLVYPTGNVDLAYVTIKGGGEAKSTRGGAQLHLVSDGTKPMAALANVDHVTVQGGTKYGVVLEARAAFSAGSHDLTVTGSGGLAMKASAGALGSIPTGSYTGNATDAIRIATSEQINEDQTLHDRGLPYVVGGDGMTHQLSVQGVNLGDVPVLTVEPGVTLKFAKSDRDSGLFVERASTTNAARGALVAVGTAAKPIVFTSEEAAPAPGDWIGIVLNGAIDPKTKISFARVDYAGGDTGSIGYSCGTPGVADPGSNEAAIGIYGVPPGQFVTNTTIASSAKNAFERGWTGAEVDFLPTNTFTSIQNCRQTYAKPLPPDVCADPPPCD